MISEATHFGRSFHFTGSASHSAAAGYRVYLYSPTTAGRTLTIPTARAFLKGDFALVVANPSANAFAVNDNAGGVLVASLTAGQWALLSLLDNTTQAGAWVVSVRTRLT